MAGIFIMFFNSTSGAVIVFVADGAFSGASMMELGFGG